MFVNQLLHYLFYRCLKTVKILEWPQILKKNWKELIKEIHRSVRQIKKVNLLTPHWLHAGRKLIKIPPRVLSWKFVSGTNHIEIQKKISSIKASKQIGENRLVRSKISRKDPNALSSHITDFPKRKIESKDPKISSPKCKKWSFSSSNHGLMTGHVL